MRDELCINVQGILSLPKMLCVLSLCLCHRPRPLFIEEGRCRRGFVQSHFCNRLPMILAKTAFVCGAAHHRRGANAAGSGRSCGSCELPPFLVCSKNTANCRALFKLASINLRAWAQRQGEEGEKEVWEQQQGDSERKRAVAYRDR